MRAKITRICSTFLVIFAVTLGIHACGGSNTAEQILAALGIQVTLAPTATATTIANAIGNGCEQGADGCDGDIADPQVRSVSVATGGDGGDNLIINIGASSFQVTSNEGGPTDDEMKLINCINGGTTAEASCLENGETSTGSTVVTASAGSVVLTADDPFAALTVSTETTGSAVFGVVNDLTTSDLYGFMYLIDILDDPASQDMVDQAVADGNLTAPAAGTDEVRITSTITINCATGGTITIIDTRDLEIDTNPNVVDSFDERHVVRFTNCDISGNFLNFGGPATVVLNGTIITIYDDDTGDESISGTITMDTDDGVGGAGNGAPFWSDSANVNILYPGGGGTSGGVCFGGNVVPGADDTVDTDDDCGAGADLFMSATEAENRLIP